MDKQTELMLRYGPKDTCWAANWGEKDEPLLRKYFAKSATLDAEDNPMVIEFFKQMERAWNDHTAILGEMEVIDIAKTKDIPTIQGLQHCARQIIIPGLSGWRYHGVGDSAIEARAYQQRLFGEIEPRADMVVGGQGSISRVSQSIAAVGIFPATFPTMVVRESAVFTNVTGYTAGVMLNRQQFAANQIAHTVGVSPFTVATDITFTGVTTWL